MGARARSRRAFRRMMDGNGQWGISRQVRNWMTRTYGEMENWEGFGIRVEKPARKPLIMNGRKP